MLTSIREDTRKYGPKYPALLKQAGISAYSIYLDEQTNTLFATLKLTDSAQLDWLSQQQQMREWWKYMSDITLSDAEGVPVLTTLNELFHLT